MPTPADSPSCRCASRPLAARGPPTLPREPCARAVPPTPVDSAACVCRLLPRRLPALGGSASTSSLSRLSRPAQDSLALRPARLLISPNGRRCLRRFGYRRAGSCQVVPTTTWVDLFIHWSSAPSWRHWWTRPQSAVHNVRTSGPSSNRTCGFPAYDVLKHIICIMWPSQ
jgi:hypothetical protein